MKFSLGPGGGVQDPEILKLLAQLTALVKSHGLKSEAVTTFIAANANKTFIEKNTQLMHTFKELANIFAPLVQGLKNPDIIPGDEWQQDSSQPFGRKDSDEPADWWKS